MTSLKTVNETSRMDPQEQTSVELESRYKNVLRRKYRIQYGGHF